MIISKNTIIKIKDIIDKNYRQMTISVLGNNIFSPEELKILKNRGVDVTNPDSLLELIYNHTFMNKPDSTVSPTSVEDMKSQQSIESNTPQGEVHDAAVEHTNENTSQLIDKLSSDVQTKFESLIRETNNKYRSNALQNLSRPDEVDELIKEGMVGEIKTKLRDASSDVHRDWERIAVTETSNTVGIAATDRIVAKNKDAPLDEVYVFRIVVNDAKLCKYCRQFYLDDDGSPKVYKLSTILGNGSNYGKKVDAWKGTTVATHPWDRCSGILELPVGYKVLSGGKLTYIGRDAWDEYIVNKVYE